MSANNRATGGTERRCYGIRVRGPIGPTMLQAFPTLTARRRGEDTMLSGTLADQSALYGVIHQLEALGLELLEITRAKCREPGRRAKSHDLCEHNSPGPARG
jgi:hypothetical protein